MLKKVITIIVFVILGVGVYFGISKFGGYKFKSDISGLETPGIAMPFESGVGELKLNNFDIGTSLPTNLFNNVFIDTDLIGGVADLEVPGVSVGIPSIGTGASSGPKPDESTCNQFKSAPSCSFVPVQYQDLCQQCKDQGY